MAIRKLGLMLFLLLLLQLHLHPASPSQSQSPLQNLQLLTAGFNQEQNIGNKQMMQRQLSTKVRVGREISVNRRGGGGGHGGGHGGRSGGRGSHGTGNGDRTRTPLQGGTGVIPLYAAGAVNHHRNYHHHHNSATLNYVGFTCLVLILLASLITNFI